MIYIDTEGDGDDEYYIVTKTSSGKPFLKRTSDGKYWNGTGWDDIFLRDK